jgi:hypothetical protein
MSHVVQMETRFTDMEALRATAAKRGVRVEVAEPGRSVARDLYEGKVAGVAAFDLPGWKYPVVVQPDGTCKYDNYNGTWGRQTELDAFAQGYGEEVATTHLTRSGYRVQERNVEADGTLQLVFVA